MIDEAFHLTPLDVRRFDFGHAFRGYDPARVDQFRDQVADELERLGRVNQDLDQKARSFHEQLRAFRERDTDGTVEYVVVLPRLVVTCRLSRSHLLDSPHTANGWHPPSDRKTTC